MVIDPQTNSLNSLTSPISLQSLSLQPINLMGTKVVIDTSGNLILNQGHIAGNSSFRDSATIKAGKSSLRISQDWESTPSSVVTTPLFDTYSWVTGMTNSGFTVNLKTPPTKEEKVNWFAIW